MSIKVQRGRLKKIGSLDRAAIGDVVEFIDVGGPYLTAFVDDKPLRGWRGSSSIYKIPDEFHHRRCWNFSRYEIEVIPDTSISQIYEEA